MNTNKKLFGQLIERYLKGGSSATESKVVEHWFDSLGSDREVEKSEKEWQDLEVKLQAKIENAIGEQDEARVVTLWHRMKWVYRAAAVLAILAMGLWWLSGPSVKGEPTGENAAVLITKENTTPSDMLIWLGDSSQVVLKTGSKITYPERFEGTKREVRLDGEGFFMVQRNPEKPFLVYCGDVVTRVLGTSFRVKQAENKKVVVEVKTGRVAVFNKQPKNPKDNGVIITPNQKATYLADNQAFVTAIVEKPEVIGVENKNVVSAPKIDFYFKNASLQTVIERLEAAYGIDIELDNEDFGNCDFHGDLSNMPFYTQLDMISQSLNASYQVKGLTILLSGKGCH